MKFDTESIIKRKKKVKIIKIILLIILVVILYNIALVGISESNKLEGINFFGYKAYIITSESMKPTINIGDVIITKPCKEEELNADDIITFSKNNEITNTHRIIKIIDEDGKKSFITKGDNNELQDEKEVKFDEIQGKVILTIPKLGKIIEFMQNKIVILVILLIILIILFISIINSEKKEIRRRKLQIEKEKES